MMNFLEKVRTLFDSRRCLLMSASLYLCSQFAIGLILRPLNVEKVLAMQTTLSPEVIASILDEWRRMGVLDIFLRHFYPDFLHPFLYCVLLLSLMSRSFNRAGLGPRWNLLLLAPPVACMMDVAENIFHLTFAADPGSITGLNAALSGLASMTKWGLAGLSLAAVIALFIMKPGRPRRRNK